MEEQRELVFHDTVPEKEENLLQAREIARKQKERVLAFFAKYPDENWTPAEVHSVLLGENIQEYKGSNPFPNILLTSVRRSITDLTVGTKKEKGGHLIKCQWSERRKGRYGRDNRTWKYNTEYITPITPKK